MQLTQNFQQVITNADQLREIIPPPSRYVADKVIDHLDEMCCRFIAASPFMIMATSNHLGDVDLSPKGDPAGFVRILDQNTLAVPDRLGNNRADSLCNLIEDDRAGLIFMVPGKRETLRISGRAAIVRDDALNHSLCHNGKPPRLAIIFAVTRVFFHCSKCMIRSGLWQPEHWPETEGLPTLAETMVRHGRLNDPIETVNQIVQNDAETRLY